MNNIHVDIAKFKDSKNGKSLIESSNKIAKIMASEGKSLQEITDKIFEQGMIGYWMTTSDGFYD